MKQIIFDEKARQALQRGANQLANAVRVTLGAKGRNVVIETGYGSPIITKDGVTVAKAVSLQDPMEAIGATLVQEVASKTNDVAGDGTTTATVLAQAMINEGLKNITAGANPLAVKRGIEKGVEAVVASLKELAKPISGDDIKKVATISANDPEIGATIAEAMNQVGHEGIITVDESQTAGVTTEVVKGMRFDRGYLSHYLVTNQDRMEAEYSDALLLVTDQKISAINEIVPLLEKIARSGKKDIVIIAEDIEGDALATLIMNKMRGTFNTLAIKAPGFGERKKDLLQDIAILTGANVISNETGRTLASVELEDLGKAHKVISTKDHTTVIDGGGDKILVEQRVTQLRKQVEDAGSDFDREKLKERLAKLTGGVGVIRVGAATEVEMKEKKHRIEDAVAATKAAIEEGIVPGGGVALLRSQKALESLSLSGEEAIGVNLLKKALEAPTRIIAENAGKDGSVVVEDTKRREGAIGYNVLSDCYEDLVAAGVVDPAKVTRCALQNAASVAAMFLTTECVISEIKEEKK